MHEDLSSRLGELLHEATHHRRRDVERGSLFAVVLFVVLVAVLERAGHGTDDRLRLAIGDVFDQMESITAIESDFDNTTWNIAFRATFPNPGGLLRHGQTGNILMASRLQNVLLIPQKATFEVLDHRYVFLVDKEHRVHATRVHIGAELQHLFVVREGLEAKDRFLLEGLRRVKDGDEVDVEVLVPDSVVAHLELYSE